MYYLPQAEGVLLHAFDNRGAAYATSGAWRSQGRALHALCLAGSPMGWPNYLKIAKYCLRVPQC